MFSNLITYYHLIAGRPLPPLTAAHHNYLSDYSVPVVAPDKEFPGVRFGEPGNAKDDVSLLYLIKFQSVLPIQEHHPPQCPAI